jgi:hypothetical protein
MATAINRGRNTNNSYPRLAAAIRGGPWKRDHAVAVDNDLIGHLLGFLPFDSKPKRPHLHLSLPTSFLLASRFDVPPPILPIGPETRCLQ